MKIKIKEAYLLILIVLGLVSLSVYSTYALFTKEVTIDNVVSFNTSISLSDSNLVEYELVTLNPNETKIIELVVSNSSTSTLYYGCWYETLSTNPDITIGMYLEKSNVPATGTIATNEVKTLVVGITNNSTSTTLVNIGVVGSTTENLGLSASRSIITDAFTPEIIVTDEYLESHTTTTLVPKVFAELNGSGNASKEISLDPGTYTLEVWGAQGGSAADIGESGGTGGKGGYSKGDITLLETTTLYLKSGGASYFNEAIPSDVGGFNGGGDSCLYDAFNSGGGGASDIRIGTDSLYARVIVAGGGGGSMGSTDGGVGGGTTGSGISPGTQSGSTGGSFGIGFSCSSTDDAGGGGGWYGGGANSGGSGYVYTASTASNYPSGCLLNSSYYLTNAETYSGNQTFTDFDGNTVTGRSGAGSVRVSGMGEELGYSIPVIYNLTDLNTVEGRSISLTDGITYECEAGKSDCTYLGPSVINTSTLEVGTHVINYKIKATNNFMYIYQRTVIVNADPRLDNSGANYPVLTDGMIPVVYNSLSNVWVKASTEKNIIFGTCNALGDVDNDGEVTVTDTRYLLQFVAGMRTFSDEQILCADLDGNGFVDEIDGQLLNQKMAGAINTFPKGTPLSTVDVTVEKSPFIWYNYDGQKWANAVLVTSTNRSTYQSASAGTTIADADILAFYVWIPRYKYKVWNINKVIGTQSYNAQTTGIDIVFEDGIASTGTINCTYSYATPYETCTGSNGDYYTHPAFTFGDDELKGFWMGKFELSSETPSATNGGGNTISLTPRILPNVISWRANTLSSSWKVIYDMQKSGNIYGLPTSRINADSHMITNMEWGAVTYLTNSKYGRCTSGSCIEVTINNCSNYITGIGGDTVSANESSTVCTTDVNKYNGEKGMLASTTGNVYGVYDMSGGAYESVMGNLSSTGTSYKYNAQSAGTYFEYSVNTAKYLTTYAYGTTSNIQLAYKRGRLGDATGEVVLTDGGVGGWYNDGVWFPYSGYGWFFRGHISRGITTAGIFSFSVDDGSQGATSDVTVNHSTRAVLAIY